MKRVYLILIFLIGIALRVIYLVTPDLDSDQSIMGLMGRHILNGEFPIFYWGENYEGPIESYLASITFYLFGSSRITLALSPFIFSLIFLILVYQLAKEIFDEKVALITLTIAAASPPFLMWYSTIANGNYIQNLVFGTLLLLMTFRFVNLDCHSDPEINSGEESRLSTQDKLSGEPLKTRPFTSFRVTTPEVISRYYIIIGFIGGLAWWVNFQIIHYLIVVFIFMFMKDRWRFIKRGVLYALPSFIMGSSLFWYYNINNHWVSITDIQKYSERLKLSDSLALFFNYKIPWVLGPFAESDIWYLNKYFMLIYGIALLYFILSYRKGILNIFRLSVKRMTGAEILPVFLSIFLIIIISRYNSGSTLRYYLPLYSVFPIILGASISNTGKIFRQLPVLLTILFISSNIYGDIKGAVIFDSKKLSAYKGDRKWERSLFDFLESKGLKYVAYHDYWTSFRLTFESGERVIFALPTEDWHPNKYPEYTEALYASSNPAFMWTSGSSINFENMLKAQGISYKKEVFGNHFHIVHSLRMPEREGRAIPSSEMTATSNYDEIDPKNAIDRDVTSVWHPKENKGDKVYFDIDMKKSYLINKLSILNGGSFNNNPSGYELEVSLDRKKWEKVSSLPALLGGFVKKEGKPVLEGGYFASVFDPVRARYIRIRQGDGEPSMNWHIAEIFVYGPSETVVEDSKNPSYLLALKYFKEKRWEEATVELLKVIETNPDSESSHYYLWLISKKLEINRSDLYHLGYNSSVLLSRLVRLYERRGDIKKAEFFREKIKEEFSPLEKRTINFGSIIEFLGYDIKHGRIPEIVYYWKAIGRIKRDWTAFVHFIDPDGKIVFQNDHLLFSGDELSSRWIKGEMYKERLQIEVPEDIRSGTYKIRIGLWDPKTGKRMKIKTGLFKKMDAIIIGELRIDKKGRY